MKLSELKIDSAKAEQGAWIGDIPDLGNLRLKVRGLGNSDARRLRLKLIRALPKASREDPKEQDKINARILAEAVLLGWENLEGEVYSKERAFEILSDPDLAPFADGVAWAAGKVAELEADQTDTDAKN